MYFARLVILGRLLSPVDFGLMGIALMIIIISDAISQPGFQHALIQSKEDVYKYLDTAWSLMIIRGAFLLAVLTASSTWAASFFNTEQIKIILPVMAIALFMSSISNSSVFLFLKKMDYKKQVFYESSGTIIEFIVAVTYAIINPSVWALVFGYFAGSLTRLITSFVLDNYRPRFSIQWEKAKKLMGFGRWITGSSILILISGFLDNFFVAKLLGDASLGYYRMAFQISNLPATEINYVANRVALPTYAKIQDDNILLKKTFMSLLRIITLITFPFSVFIIFLGHDFVMLLLGEKWLPMVFPMQILGMAGLVKSLTSTGTPLFTGTAYPKYEMITQGIRCLIFLITIYVFTFHYNMTGTAVSVLISVIAMVFPWLFFSGKIIKAGLFDYLRQLAAPLIGALAMAAFFYFLPLNIFRTETVTLLSYLVFIVALITGSAVYLAIVWVMNKTFSMCNNIDDVKLLYSFFRGRVESPDSSFEK